MILMYHRVVSVSSDVYGMAVTPEQFRAHMAVLRQHYSPLPLDQLVDAARSGGIPDAAVAITFDDGYVDNLTTASPILVEAGLPATFFLTTDGLDEPTEYWWDASERIFFSGRPIPSSLDLYADGRWVCQTSTLQERAEAHRVFNDVLRPLPALEQRNLLDRVVAWSGLDLAPREAHRRMVTEEVRDLGSRPLHTIGAHTARHLWLPTQLPDVQRSEIVESRQKLERLLARPVLAFAYPYGAHDDSTRRLVGEAGFTSAVTVRAGRVSSGTNPLLLPRIEIRAGDADAFAARLTAVLHGTID
jgi:peptidoglycan/xylan/chitin deacetylase (PgdA/CDA1 family)